MSNMPWLRLYADMVDNEKIRLLSFDDRWHFVAILCCKQQGILEGKRDLTERKLAVKLGVQLRELDEIKRRLMEVELVDESFNPIGWDSKQFKSDSSADRVRKYRENNKKKTCNVTETLPERNSNAIDTDTDTDTEKKNKQKENPNFKKPTVQEISDYCEERKNGLNAETIFDHYEANGWMRGKAKIKDWKACVRTWEKNKPIKSPSADPDLYARYYQ